MVSIMYRLTLKKLFRLRKEVMNASALGTVLQVGSTVLLQRWILRFKNSYIYEPV